MIWNQKSICDWSKETFGDHVGGPIKKVTRMNIEVAELLSEIEHGQLEKAKSECADIFIVLVQLSKDSGVSVNLDDFTYESNERNSLSNQAAWISSFSSNLICDVLMFRGVATKNNVKNMVRALIQMSFLLDCDLREEVQKKMEINKNRKWRRLDGGRHQHVE